MFSSAMIALKSAIFYSGIENKHGQFKLLYSKVNVK